MMTSVYIVEDESLLRDFMKDLVGREAELSFAGASGDAETAFEECRKLQPDMLISDVRLPGIDGVDLSKKLRDCLPDIKILLVSAFFTPAVIRRALLAKVNGILEKNAGLSEMEKALAAVASGQTYYGDAILRSLPDLLSAKAEPHPVENLTAREKEILCLIADGLSTREIADRLKISTRTADVHRMHIMAKLDCHSVAGLTRIAIAGGLVDLAMN
jgi:DNA-binding NarL/FixJ family response regulator